MTLVDFLRSAIINDFCESCEAEYRVDLTDSYIGRDHFDVWLPEVVDKYTQNLDDDDLVELIISSLSQRGDHIKEELFKELIEMYAVKKLVSQMNAAPEKPERTSPE